MSEQTHINETNGRAKSPNKVASARNTESHQQEELLNSYSPSVPARFRQVHESDASLYLANEHRSRHIEAEEVVLPHKSLEPAYNLRIDLEETSIEEVRDAIEEALAWLHRVEAHLPISAEATK